ncbi:MULTISPECIES: 5,6-dimethylbenzimidazole synthase [unclassified Terrabacter]|uniref:5,6-dimethylbenzimidazole synthase n=1 Tax=unclassified Terrabacter TaxID=2630222 RepID=UPI0006FCF3E2|nr:MULTISPECIES: 5,6-dimethylbenzimidazole synthase [unclassified Terrabacter]KRB47301.1 5,6-dimethylbenzimidazole synthase [Terrabacter sp. Root181]KRF38720.1 5,6-dimethylbenzimidazole synthase [Terrabacter sp. Soil810]
MSYRRPVPTIGDPSSAAERAQAPDAWALRDDLASLERVVGARRDIRRFRPDPVPDDVLTAVLTAGHRGPSVGHSQPWRFVVVTEAATRDTAALMADRCRLRQAAGMAEESARGLLDLRLEGIREAPVGVVVACDRRTPAAGVLGRATFPDADLWSCAAAIENMWLTARAHGLGLGWVTLFEPAELADLLGLPEGVETLGWLCLGWPDERPPEPGLERAGWSKRLPLDEVVMRERWTERDAPTSHLRAPEPADVVAARDRSDDLLTVPGSLGVLDTVLDRITALAAVDGRGTLVVAAADHAVTAYDISAFDPSVTADVARATREGTSMGAVAARAAGMDVELVDAGIGCRRGDLVATDALDKTTYAALLGLGRDRGRALASAGPVALGEVGVGNTTVAAALAGALLDVPADEVVGRGSSADTAMVDRKRDVVTRALARVGRVGPDEAVRRLGGGELAVLTGITLGVAESGGVVVLDGLATAVCALAAVRLEPAVAAHLVAGQRSREKAHALVLRELGLEPLLDLRIRAGEGVGAALATGLVKDALALRAGVARTSTV